MSSRPVLLNLHAIATSCAVNGPGRRLVIWVQGCVRGCAGCANPEKQATDEHLLTPVTELLTQIQEAAPELEGITLTGGEPLEQAAGVLSLVRAVRQTTSLSVILFSGYRKEEIEAQPLGPDVLAHVDVLVDGPYESSKHLGSGLRGSSNQRLVFLTDRYTKRELESLPDAEILIRSTGEVEVTGLGADRLRDLLPDIEPL